LNTIIVEIKRLLGRRLIRVLILLTVAGMLVASTISFFRANTADESLEVKLARKEKKEQECLAGEVRFPKWVNLEDENSVEDFCEFRRPYVEDPRFHYSDMPGILEPTSGVWLGLALIIGASFIGAEWHSGNIATTLTWEPRRNRLYLSKAVALSACVFAATIALQLLLSLLLAPVGIFRGTTTGLNGAFWGDMATVMLKASFLAVAIGLLGFGLASIGRNTAAAVGIMFAYTAVVENLVRAVRPQFFGWLLSDNIIVFISGEVTMFGEKRSSLAAFVTICVYALVPLLAGLSLFKKRDVT
jgi:hypothetical protein